MLKMRVTLSIFAIAALVSEIVKIIPTSFAQVFFLFSRRKSLRIVNYLKNFQRRKMEKEQAKSRNYFDILTKLF